MIMSGLMQRYNESLQNMSDPVLPSEMPPVIIDYRGLIAYAEERGVQPVELTEQEKRMFMREKKVEYKAH